jgi:osmotically-inducible protein OsmY
VNRILAADTTVAPYAMLVESGNGIVSLSGSVDNVAAERRAVADAQIVHGVRAVIDRVALEPLPMPDPLLASRVAGALAADPTTAPFAIAASANVGNVTLTGDVDALVTRDIAERDAARVVGVRSVNDRLKVRATLPRDDAEVAAEIGARLERDSYVPNARMIAVKVDRGAARLSGFVGGTDERARAIADAGVRGVREVDARSLRINQDLADPRRRASPAPPLGDAQLAQTIVDAWRADPRLQNSKPVVTVKGATALLTGHAFDATARRAAEEDARNTVGVIGVESALH